MFRHIHRAAVGSWRAIGKPYGMRCAKPLGNDRRRANAGRVSSIASRRTTTMANVVNELLDREALLERVEGDRELLSEMVALFLDDCPNRLAQLRDALLRGDAADVALVAHSIKGSVCNLSACAATDAAAKLEKLASSGDLSLSRKAGEDLERELARLQPALKAIVRGD
jgi:HPt (histidine-containing phosphotransfer) domain-containing protein